MPRTKLGAAQYAAEDFRREVRVKMGYYGIRSQRALAAAAGIDPCTLSRRLRDPQTLSLMEIGRLHKVLHLDLTFVLLLLCGISKKEVQQSMERLNAENSAAPQA